MKALRKTVTLQTRFARPGQADGLKAMFNYFQ